ncbi:MAG: gliding motility-associated C-terminal domain-containing protein [Bacteroidota bacterium]
MAFIVLVLLTKKQYAQCTWGNLLFDSFEYSQSTTSPDFIPGVNYGVAHPDTYAAHSGSQSVYINFVDSNLISPPGTHGGTLFYRKTIAVCPNTPYRVSMWFCTTFAGMQCNVRILLKDATGAVLNTVNNFPCPYAPAFGQYSSGVITPTTSSIILDLYTNVGGGGGNDLGVDDLLIEQCLTPSPGIKMQTALCSTSPTLNLYGLFNTIRPTYGTWAGPSILSGGYLGTYNPSVNLQGQYLYSYNFQNNSNCPLIKDTVNVVMPQTPNLSINQGTICAGQQTATLTASGAANYTWAPSSGLNTTSSGTVAANPSTTTTYTVIGANGNCRDTITTQVVVNSLPVLTVNSATICSGASVTLTASGASVYSWSPILSLNTASGATVISTPPSSVIYSITGTVGSCTAVVNSSVSVTPSPTLSVNSMSICRGAEANLSVSGATSYTWFPSTALSTTTGSMVTSSSPVTITYTVIGLSGNCFDTTKSTVTVNPMPLLTANSVTVCSGFQANLLASGASVYSWSPSTNLNTTSGASVIATPTVSTEYIITGSLGMCTSTLQAVVHVNPLPDVSIQVSSSIINTPGESVSLTASGGNTYLWSNGLATALISVAPSQTSNYCVTAITPEGCEQKTCITIEVSLESTLYIPNAFTPNGDNLNDVLYTPGTNITSYHLVIYNRWGNLVFESRDAEHGWDGTYRGERVKDDVYNYLLVAEGIDHEVYKKTGFIAVLK